MNDMFFQHVIEYLAKKRCSKSGVLKVAIFRACSKQGGYVVGMLKNETLGDPGRGSVVAAMRPVANPNALT